VLAHEHEGRLIVDLDTRLFPLWEQIFYADDEVLRWVAPLLRMAYGMGYQDSLVEKPRGQFYRDHGWAVPARGNRIKDSP
jgi:hypothetical protein